MPFPVVSLVFPWAHGPTSKINHIRSKVCPMGSPLKAHAFYPILVYGMSCASLYSFWGFSYGFFGGSYELYTMAYSLDAISYGIYSISYGFTIDSSICFYTISHVFCAISYCLYHISFGPTSNMCFLCYFPCLMVYMLFPLVSWYFPGPTSKIRSVLWLSYHVQSMFSMLFLELSMAFRLASILHLMLYMLVCNQTRLL